MHGQPRAEETGEIVKEFPCPTLPYDECSPALFMQLSKISLIPQLVGGELRSPLFTVVFGGRGEPAVRMSVPETTMNEHDGTVLWQTDIRASREVFPVQAETETVAMQN